MQNLPSPGKFWRDETGAETLEYALISGLIMIAAVLVYVSFGSGLTDRLDSAAGDGGRGRGCGGGVGGGRGGGCGRR